MEHTIEFGGELQAVTVTSSGRADRSGFLRFIDEIVSDPRFRRGMAMLIDHSALDASSLTRHDVQAIGELVGTLSDRVGTSPVAVVVPDTLLFGLTRMGEAHTGPAQLRVGIFYSRDEAIAWLRDAVADT